MHTHAVDEPWVARKFEITTNRVCGTCNGGWMNELESAAKSELEAMLDSKPVVIRDPAPLAAWTYKTALVWQLAIPGPNPIPAEHYQYLREHMQPPPTAQVSIGRFGLSKGSNPNIPEGVQAVGFRSAEIMLTPHEGTDLHGYAAAFHVTYFAAHVFGHGAGLGVFRVSFASAAPNRPSDMLIPIWPLPAGAIDWPPAVSWDAASLDRLVVGWN